MRYIFIILFFTSVSANATNYYVANAGSDANNGTSKVTAWQTISKVNLTASSGDSVFFNSGDLWIGQLKPAASNIYYGSYGTGINPIITGFQTVTGFYNVTGNIWRAVATSASTKLNTVLINGSLGIKGRFPNTGYLTFQSYSGNTSITSSSLTGTPNYTGKIVFVRGSHFTIDTSTIATQSGSTLTFSTPLTYIPSLGGNGFAFENDSSFVDTANEYSFNNVTKSLIVYSPSSPTVLVSTIDTLVWIKWSNITFNGLSFIGANINAFQVDTSRGITIKNCSIKYCGSDGVTALKSNSINITNDSIQYCLNTGINLSPLRSYSLISQLIPNACDSAKIMYCYIKNTGIYPGMALNGPASTSNGIWSLGSYDTISYNRLDSAGYCSLQTFGLHRYIYKNYITNFCFVKDDGGGIKSGIITGFPSNYDSASTVRGNFVSGGIGNTSGTTGTISPSSGIYFDNYDNGILCDSNTVSNCVSAGIINNTGHTNSFLNNTVIDSTGACITITGTPVTQVYGEVIKGNIFYSQSTSQVCINRDQTDYTETIDSNYYLRPRLETGKMQMAAAFYDLPSWVSATGYDAHSSSTPTGTTGAYLFYYTYLSPVMITVPATYIDPKGNFYYGYSHNNQFILNPFSSIILLKTTIETFLGNVSGVKYRIR